jgi:hypothetical protein
MSYFFYAASLLLLVSFVVFARQTVSAPEGHEDEMGFHFGALAGERRSHRHRTARSRKAVAAFAKVTTRHLAA